MNGILATTGLAAETLALAGGAAVSACIAGVGLFGVYANFSKSGLEKINNRLIHNWFEKIPRLILLLSVICFLGGVLASYSLGTGAYWLGKAVWMGTATPSLLNSFFGASLGLNCMLASAIGVVFLLTAFWRTECDELKKQLSART